MLLEVEVEREGWQICNFVSHPKSHPHIYVYIWCVFPAKRVGNCHILKVETIFGGGKLLQNYEGIFHC